MTRVIIEDKSVDKKDIKSIGYHPYEKDEFNIVIFFNNNTQLQCDIFYKTRDEVKKRLRELNWYIGGIVWIRK